MAPNSKVRSMSIQADSSNRVYIIVTRIVGLRVFHSPRLLPPKSAAIVMRWVADLMDGKPVFVAPEEDPGQVGPR